MIVVRAREDDDGDARPLRHVGSPSSLISKLSMRGFARSSAHIRWICAVAVLGAVRLELEVDHPPDARASDVEAELPQGVPDRLALRVEDAVLRPDEHGRLHRTTSGSAR